MTCGRPRQLLLSFPIELNIAASLDGVLTSVAPPELCAQE